MTIPFDLQSTEVVASLVLSLLTILGTIFGWFGKAWSWVSSLCSDKPTVGLIDVPIFISNSHPNALWWHMGTLGGQPAMQIVGDFNVTNISKHNVVVMGAKLGKLKAVGHVMLRSQDSNMYGKKHTIPQGGISDLRFDFLVQPPVNEEGKLFKADVAIIDQFGIEHWLKELEFLYS